MDFFSPLRYPGGKGKVAKYFKSIFRSNNLCDGTYVEPYAGGASVGLSLLFYEYAKRIIINDKDLSIYSFWHSVLFDTENLCRLINDCKVDVENWDKQRLIQKNKTEQEILDLGFSTFFLNRCNRSGIIMAGIIGGRKQSGLWKINARFNKNDLINRIYRIANYKDRIDLYNKDAVDLIKKISVEVSEKSLIYLDPPYFIKGKQLYMNHYQTSDHETICSLMGTIQKQKWIVSYDNIQNIRDLYYGYRQIYYNLNYSAGNKAKGEEVIIFSNNLTIPFNDDLQLKKVI